MTENEALEELKTFPINCLDYKENQALQVAIQALEEIQQYRAIGTVEEFKAFKLGRLCNKGFITIGQTIEEFKEEIRNKAIDEVIMQLEAEVESSAKFIREYDDSIAQKAYYSGLYHALRVARRLKEGAE